MDDFQETVRSGRFLESLGTPEQIRGRLELAGIQLRNMDSWPVAVADSRMFAIIIDGTEYGWSNLAGHLYINGKPFYSAAWL